VPVTIHCALCQRDVDLDGVQALTCPQCGAQDVRVVRGKELELAALEVDAP
jgi:Zn finger protein HypA/HybF involved in hydrogenase expression